MPKPACPSFTIVRFRGWARACGLAAGLLLALARPGAAYFEDLGLGVRPIGMGEAFTAVADDSNAVLWNSAGLADLTMRELNTAYAALFANLNARLYTGELENIGLGNIGVAVPFEPRVGTFGFFWTQFSSRFYRENSFTLSYGREVGSSLYSLLKVKEAPLGVSINAGINLKLLDWRVTPNDYTQTNAALQGGNLSRTGFTADLGLLAESPEKIKFGVSLENIIPTDVGVTVRETVPFNLRLGTSYTYDWNGKLGSFDSLCGALDFTHRATTAPTSDIRFGAEGWFFKNMIALRLGTTVDEFTAGASYYTPVNYSDMAMRLDYAFTYPYVIKDTLGSHRIAVVLRWGSIKPEVKPAPVKPAETLPAEENLAAKREQELAAERARDEAKLRETMAALQAQLKKMREDLAKINDLVRLGQLAPIQFENGKSSLLKSSYAALDRYGAILQKYPGLKVRVEGHTDNVGKPKRNQELSQRRVESVKSYLLAKYGANAANLIPVGYGDTRPVASNKTAEGRAQNRRVELKPLIPAGMESLLAEEQAGASPEAASEPISSSDVVTYDEVEQLKAKLKVYEMQMNSKDVEEMFQRQHKNAPAAPAESQTPPPGSKTGSGGK